MCGIIGMIVADDVNQAIFDGLTSLQHRGQDAAGMVTCQEGSHLFLRKANGLVRDVFRTRHMMRLKGNMGIGHVRYPTAGSDSAAEAQPFYVNSPYGITLAHNGNLTNADQLKEDLFRDDLRHLNTGSDSEILLNIFAHKLQQLHKLEPSPDDIFKAVTDVHDRCRGGYAVVSMLTGIGIVAFRDPHGIRPLVYGRREVNGKTEHIFASESCALDALDFELVSDVAPGEAIYVTVDGQLHRRQCATGGAKSYSPCLFEYVYLARPDSIIDNISVYKVRLKAGEALAEKFLEKFPDHDVDVVMPVPDTSRVAAIPMARKMGVEFREGLIKNRYIGRTFIMPGQDQRRRSVRQKLNALELEFRGKNVLLVDDSIVRGTTCREIIDMARQAGAKKVYFASAAPEVRHPNVYGIDMPVPEELVAYNRTVDELCDLIGADGLVFQDLDALVDAARAGNSEITRFEDSVFTGDYITGDVDKTYLDNIAQRRNDAAKNNTRSGDTLMLSLDDGMSEGV